MSIAKAKVVKSVVAKFSEMCWILAYNFSREAKSYMDVYEDEADKARVALMIADGWDFNCPVTVVEVKSEEQRALITSQLEDTWKRLKDSVVETPITRTIETKDGLKAAEIKIAPAEILRQFEAIWVTNGKLNVKHIKYDPVFAFRRGGVIPLANAIRFRDQLPLLTEIPVNVVEFENEHERVKMCIEENTHQLKGTRLIDKDWKSLTKAAIAFRDSGIKSGKPVREIDMKNTFDLPHGSGQKLFAIIMLDAKYPALKLSEAVIAGRTDGSSLAYTKMNELRRDDADPVVVQNYFASPLDPNQKKEQRAKESDVKAYIESHPILLVRAVLLAELKNNMASLAKYIPLAAELNKLTAQLDSKPIQPEPIEAQANTPMPPIG